MTETLKRVVSVSTYPVLLAGAVGAVLVGLRTGVQDELVLVTATVFVSSLIVLALQRFHPFQPEWQRWGPDAGVDLLHMIFSTGGATALVRATSFGALYWLADMLATLSPVAAWPNHWPVLIQLPIALLVAELGAYWVHRLSHEWGWLWRLHALHHSSERLYMFSSGRNHPVHTALTYFMQMTPLILLGAGGEVLALAAAFTSVNGLLQHANIDLELGPLNWIFATCDLHRWHHSASVEESHCNFGNNLIVWDVVFGTRLLPSDRRGPAAVGLGGIPFPTDYVRHLLSPLIWGRLVARAAPAEAQQAPPSSTAGT